MKYIKTFEYYQINENENENIKYLINQINDSDWKPLNNDMFEMILEEGWIDELEDKYSNLTINDFLFKELEISDNDKHGLINFNDDIVEKFNNFDIALKDKQEYPFYIIDFIDYDNGLVYLFKHLN